MSQPAPGARSSSRRIRLDALAALAVVLPLLTAGALLLVRPDAPSTAVQPPTRTALTSATVACPTAQPAGGDALVATAQEGASGRVQVRSGSSTTSLALRSGRPSAVRGAGPLAVTGQDELAPGLLGGRFSASRQGLAGSSCPAPSADQWFTGVGADPRHSSVLELVNPDAGRAVADVTVLGPTGPVDVARLRGVAVLGHSSVRLDLAALAPRRGDLALHVVTSRGRLSGTVLDSVDELGAGRSSQDWLPAQAAPGTDSLLLGLAPGTGSRTLVVANPGESEVRVQLKVVSPRSSYVPAGTEPFSVPAGSTVGIPVEAPLRSAPRGGALGLELAASGPVTATVRSFVDGDLSAAVPAGRFAEPTATVLPGARAQLLLSGARRSGRAAVTGWSATGRRVLGTHVTVTPGRGTALGVPARVRLLTVDPGRTSMSGAVLVTGRGATVLPLPELVRNGLVPAVRPGLS
jgi:hypothetical protein